MQQPNPYLPSNEPDGAPTETYTPQHYERRFANHQPLAVSRTTPIPGYPAQETHLLHPHFIFAQDQQGIMDPNLWSRDRVTEADVPGMDLRQQPTTGVPSMSDGSPRSSIDQSKCASTNMESGCTYTAPQELPLQEPEDWTPGWLAYSPAAGQSPLPPPPTTSASDDVRVFRCRWQGCRSNTSFRREADLIRHLRTVHISPKAFPCMEPDCGMGFGRRDHLRMHRRSRHGR
ncbi:hypothetical protein BJX64DRAFT_285232 [Aspergillus heterothallicus]